MNILNSNKFKVGSARQIAICSVLAIAVSVPATSFAAGGYWSQNRGITKVRAKVQKVSKNVVKKTAAAPAKAKERIENLADQVEEIVAQIRENQPLLNHIKDGPLVSAIGDTLQFIQDNQEDFQQFVSQQGEYFRDDIRNLLSDFIAISQESPLARQRGKVLEKMQNAVNLIDKLPPVFLYPMYKSVGPRLEEMQEMVSSMRAKLAALPKLPPMMELYKDPMAHAQTMCDFVTDKKVAVHVATIQAILKTGVWSIGVVLDQLPKDLTVNATVVGGGGTTVSAHPARAPFNVIKTILEGTDLGITQYKAIGTSVCVASGLHTPS